MNRKISLGAAISFMAVVAAITFTITMIFSLGIFNEKVHNVKEREELYKKVSEVDHLIRENFVGELDEDALLGGLSEGFVNGAKDSYAAYYDAETFHKIQQIEEGKLTGIGAELVRDDSGYLRMVHVYEGSPAASAGLQDGDLLISVEGADTKALDFEKASRMLMGEAGTTLHVSYRREDVDTECDILRKSFDQPVVSMTVREDGNAYVRIASFSASAVEQFRRAMNEAEVSEVSGLVFDLRNTAGGSLESACRMLDVLLPLGDLLSAVYKDGTTELLYRSDANEIDLPMVVLVNEKTQYAAELFAANLMDYEKAKLIGGTTYGQGLMQKSYQLRDGSGVVLSNAYYTSAVSANFDRVGLKPDYEVALGSDAEKALLYGTLEEADDLPLQKALEVLETSK